MKRHRFQRTAAILGLFLSTALTGCTHDPVGVDAQPMVCYTTEVKPIILNNCAKSGCHAGGHQIDFSSDAGIVRYVVPFKPEQSSLYTATTSTWIQPMPPSPNPALTQTQRTTIALWILQGANTSCGS
ncbi:MAG: hypothetical protein IH600_03970 [Bacteroidetes bacterium]|nr:hypothetical protein [Bacteroidota bacterium]